jgi:hypothetical protein
MRINGVRFGAPRGFWLPQLEPEKVLAQPLELALEEKYRYTLEGTDTVDGVRPASLSSQKIHVCSAGRSGSTGCRFARSGCWWAEWRPQQHLSQAETQSTIWSFERRAAVQLCARSRAAADERGRAKPARRRSCLLRLSINSRSSRPRAKRWPQTSGCTRRTKLAGLALDGRNPGRRPRRERSVSRRGPDCTRDVRFPIRWPASAWWTTPSAGPVRSCPSSSRGQSSPANDPARGRPIPLRDGPGTLRDSREEPRL